MELSGWIIGAGLLGMASAVCFLAYCVWMMARDGQSHAEKSDERWAALAKSATAQVFMARAPDIRLAEMEKECYALQLRLAEVRPESHHSPMRTPVAGINMEELEREVEMEMMGGVNPND